MCSLFSFLAYSEAQNRVLKSIDGVIIYPYRTSGIPEYIHFWPKKLGTKDSLKSLFKLRALKIPDKFFVLYFNPIRWIVPDLAETMNSLKRIPIKYGEFNLSFILSYGRITFDITPELKIADPEVSSVYHVPLVISDKQYFIDIVDLPDKMGLPKIFEKIEFKW